MPGVPAAGALCTTGRVVSISIGPGPRRNQNAAPAATRTNASAAMSHPRLPDAGTADRSRRSVSSSPLSSLIGATLSVPGRAPAPAGGRRAPRENQASSARTAAGCVLASTFGKACSMWPSGPMMYEIRRGYSAAASSQAP